MVVQRRNLYQKILHHRLSGGTAHRNEPHAPPSGHFAGNKLSGKTLHLVKDLKVRGHRSEWQSCSAWGGASMDEGCTAVS